MNTSNLLYYSQPKPIDYSSTIAENRFLTNLSTNSSWKLRISIESRERYPVAFKMIWFTISKADCRWRASFETRIFLLDSIKTSLTKSENLTWFSWHTGAFR